MSKLIEAEKRLERAIAELEQATSLSGVVHKSDAQGQADEMDRILLRTEDLQAVHETVSKKIDATILRLKDILEG
ncbi:MAG: hypothetical protein VYB39_02055 [Pseudomonadota bacterium]|nr:hypothetical protein [Pseudomonadota bacterium]